VEHVASPKFSERANISTLSERKYFVWETTSQSSKQQDMLEIVGRGSLATPMRKEISIDLSYIV